MSESNDTDKTPPAGDEAAPSGNGNNAPAEDNSGTPASGGGRILAVVALVLALLVAGGAAGGGYYLYLQLQAVERTAATRASEQSLERLSETLTSRAQALDDRVDNLAGRTSSQSENVAQFREELANLRQDQRALAERMDHFETLAESRRFEWARSEAAYLASVALTRLNLHRDVDSALQALKEADKLLAGFGGRTVDARQGLSRAIDALLAVDRPDVGVLSERLMGLSASVDSLPLRGDRRSGETEADAQPADAVRGEGWRAAVARAWRRFKASLSELVVVHRAEDQPPLVSPEQRLFLTQNLRLQLETARAALVRGEPQLYRDSLRQAERWLREFHDTERTVVSTALQELQALRESEIRAELPDIKPMLAPLTGGGDA